MEKIFKNLKYLILISIVFIILLFYFFVYRPMRNELEASFKRDFTHIVSISETNLENYFKNQVEGTESLSSRTMIREKFYDYKQDDISLNMLKNYTQPKYVDGVKALKGIKGALRISIDNKIIASCGKVNRKHLNDYLNFKNDKTMIKILLPKNIMIVSSPIYEKKELLGYDIAFFNLENILNEISQKQIDYSIVKNPKYMDKIKVFDNKIATIRQILTTKYWLKAEMSKTRFASTLRKISILVGAVTVISLLIIILIFRIVIDKTAKEVIEELENKNEEVTYLSFHDELTGLYNRRYFENEMKRLDDSRRLPISIIIGDIDNLKHINDTYGHEKGDEYIKMAAGLFDKITRSEDVVARIGGDEFAIILPEANFRDIKKFSIRFFSKLENFNNKNDLKEPLKISIGYATMRRNDRDIKEIYNEADERMYQNKKNKKS